jgi:hypothetical protein
MGQQGLQVNVGVEFELVQLRLAEPTVYVVFFLLLPQNPSELLLASGGRLVVEVGLAPPLYGRDLLLPLSTLEGERTYDEIPHSAVAHPVDPLVVLTQLPPDCHILKGIHLALLQLLEAIGSVPVEFRSDDGPSPLGLPVSSCLPVASTYGRDSESSHKDHVGCFGEPVHFLRVLMMMIMDKL